MIQFPMDGATTKHRPHPDLIAMNNSPKNARRNSLQKRSFVFESLENREVLNSPSAVWLGQTGVDQVGPWNDLKPSSIQDISVQLDHLPTDRTITRAVVQGHGADRWEFGGPAGSWLVDLERPLNSEKATLYFEPARLETGREFSVGLTYDDGTFQEIYFPGGTADPNLKVAGQGVQANWMGSSAGVDLTTPSAAIGPDGITDLQISLAQLDPLKSVKAVDVVDANNVWIASYGLNPSRVGTAELSRNPSAPDQGTLTFSASNRTIAGPLTIQVTYANDSKDSTTCSLGSLSTSPISITPNINFTSTKATADWQGQVVTDPERAGWVRVSVNSLPTRGISAWQLNDPSGQTWLWTITGEGSPWTAIPDTRSLIASQDFYGNWTLEFDTRWDLSGKSLNLLAAADDGRYFSIDLTGGSVDLSKRSPAPDTTEIITAPGTDLQDLVNRFGTVRLSDGIYNLTQPLILKKPVNLIGSSKAILQFSQATNDPGWTASIKLAAGNIRLAGFQVQFASPIRWRENISYGPAVIGTPDNYDTALGRVGAMPNLVLEGLNIQGPRPNSLNEEAPRLMRMIGDVSGQIRRNTLFGGLIEVVGGPWAITNNTHTGTWAGSFNYDTIAAHDTHGLTVTDNIVTPSSDSGTVFRFLVVTGQSSNVSVINNRVIGLGAKFTDSPEIQGINAHEVILTEAYHVAYEGSLLGLDISRRQIRVGNTLARDYQPGDQVAILDGPAAGSYRTVQAVLNATTLLLDQPLPDSVQIGTSISINKGMTNLNLIGNVIDQTNRPQSLGMVLVGNLYGVNVSNNRIIGGLRGIQVIAYPSETPRDWGWTRNVVQGLSLTGNQFSDVLWFNQVMVSHSNYARANYGRLYLTGEVAGNTFQWSETFLRSQLGQSPADSNLLLPALQIGDQGVWDDHESNLKLGTNSVDLPLGWLNRPALWTQSGTINGQAATGQLLPLTAVLKLIAPTGLALVNDSGISVTDGLTNDPRIRFDSIPGLSYEYRVAGSPVWKSIATPSAWTPSGLSEGLNQLEVRAYDGANQRGPAGAFSFKLDTTAPAAPTGLIQKTFDSAAWQSSSSPDATGITATLKNAVSTETQSLPATALGTTFTRWINGSNRVEISSTDAAGNRSFASTTTWNYICSGSWGGQDGSDFASLNTSLKSDGKQDVRLDIQGLPSGKTVISLNVIAFGGGQWAWPSATTGTFGAAWRPSTTGRSGAIYFQTNRREIGRPFNIILKFSDGTSQNFWMQGGVADPNLSVKSGLKSASVQAFNVTTTEPKTVVIPMNKKVSVAPKTKTAAVARTSTLPKVIARKW